MPVGFDISDEEIGYSESILLNRKNFDQERIEFIRDWSTIDLHAVPGSGKTTAILAKLLILEQKLPLKEGRGVLILSHTNAAVNEIKTKLCKLCPRLFSYPNFIGTIQSFVDKFLTNPYFSHLFKNKVQRIDTALYHEYNAYFRGYLDPAFSEQDKRNALAYLIPTEGLINKIQLVKTLAGFDLIKDRAPLEIHKPQGNTRPENYHDWSEQEKNTIRRWVISFKLRIMKRGFLSFDDAYNLANSYLMEFPHYGDILRKRFEYIFVDEMQDVSKQQHDLLEVLFHNSAVSFQRIGDQNQAIYDAKSDGSDVWKIRNTSRQLTGSHRLSPRNAAIVKTFAVQTIGIEGKQKKNNGDYVDIKPHLIIYNDNNIKQVIHAFGDLITKLKNQGEIPESNSIFKAICWRQESESGRLSLGSYNPNDSSNVVDQRSYKNTLWSFITAVDDVKRKSLRFIQSNILDAFLRIFRIEIILDERNKHFTKDKFFATIRQKDPLLYDQIRRKLFRWSIDILKRQESIVFEDIKSFVGLLLRFFHKTPSKALQFINSGDNSQTFSSTGISNLVKINDIEIELATVHSVKGQTHTATMYLESFFGQGGGDKRFESQRLSNQIKGTPFPSTGSLQSTVKKSARMVYVGFSRPTHLLCFAVHQSRFDEYLHDTSTDNWEIIRLEENIAPPG